ncbi:MAG: His/Gly/Thr/Pro-type tRNA ligase C-terminal domain-containing protein, partial [Actinomycetota bacterium]
RSSSPTMTAHGAPERLAAFIVGEDEREAGTVTIRDMRGDTGQRDIPRADLLTVLREVRP